MFLHISRFFKAFSQRQLRPKTAAQFLHERNHWISIENRSVSQFCMWVCVCEPCVCGCFPSVYVCCGCLAATSVWRLKLQLPCQKPTRRSLQVLNLSLFLPLSFFLAYKQCIFIAHMYVHGCVCVPNLSMLEIVTFIGFDLLGLYVLGQWIPAYLRVECKTMSNADINWPRPL